MKAILMSIKPQHTCNILNDIKWWEIRKKFPKDYVGWVYIYCTKGKPTLYLNNGKPFIDIGEQLPTINGKVVARFWCDKVEDYVYGHKWSWEQGAPMWGADNSYEAILKDMCLTDEELRAYVDDLCFSAIHITKLEIFDKPKELKNFLIYSHTVSGIGFKGEEKQFKILKPLTRAPQSWCYVEI